MGSKNKAFSIIICFVLVTNLFSYSALAKSVKPKPKPKPVLTVITVISALMCEGVNTSTLLPYGVKNTFDAKEQKFSAFIRFNKPYAGLITGGWFFLNGNSKQMVSGFRQQGNSRTNRFLFWLGSSGCQKPGRYQFVANYGGKNVVLNFSVVNNKMVMPPVVGGEPVQHRPSTTVNQPVQPLNNITEIPTDVNELAKMITAGCTTDAEKVRAIHDWVACNIEYDVDAYHNPYSASTSIYDLLRTKKGVCSAFSRLVKALLDAAGIQNRIVEGWARWPAETWQELLMRSPSLNHSWNEAWVNGRWLAMDVTWDAGYVDSGITHFTKQFRLKYFDANSELFANDHSAVRPTALPPNIAGYYFRLSYDDSLTIQNLAVNHLRMQGGYEYATLWTGPAAVVGKVEGSKIKALALVGANDNFETQACTRVELEKTPSGWVITGSQFCPNGCYLPTGAYQFYGQ